MTTLHVFNPEHDIALASHLANFTAPHAGRQLRADLGFLPALWAEEGDVVLVDNVEYAEKEWRNVCRRISRSLGPSVLSRLAPVRLGTYSSAPREVLATLKGEVVISVWGWDKALKASLIRNGVPATLLPSDELLEQIRQLSHRRTAASLLSQLQTPYTVGEAVECRESSEVQALLEKYGQVVMKAPWSSSGRGLRFLSMDRTPFEMQERWFGNLVERQGSVMVEPLYHKVKDFGMEFFAEPEGKILYKGLSLFHTLNGAYVGNILATERVKRDMINYYIPIGWIDDIQQKIMSCVKLTDYVGPFGVDMMIVNGADGFMLHPCVEINLRRTMGHVALSLTPDDDEVVRVMRIEMTDCYKLKINKL